MHIKFKNKSEKTVVLSYGCLSCFYGRWYVMLEVRTKNEELNRKIYIRRVLEREGENMADLVIDERYYNSLDIEGFSRMMKNPTYCYKFYWLEAIVQLIAENKKQVTYDEIINEMIYNAWYSVLEFHIHLSGLFGEGELKDNLEKAVLRLQELSQLPNHADKIEIKNELTEYSGDKKLHKYKMELTKYVPYKVLSGFANRGAEKIDLNSTAGRMMAYYNKLSGTEILLPYVFGDGTGLNRTIFFNDGWIQMIQDNTVAILGWIQLEKVKWLQNNNPEMPGLVYKMVPLDEKMRKLDHVRKLWEGVLNRKPVIDVFTNERIDKNHYDVDHFIPWSFVMNNECQWILLGIRKKVISFRYGIPFSKNLQLINIYCMSCYILSQKFINCMKPVTGTTCILFGQIKSCIGKGIHVKSFIKY